ncbi:hypothetical protein RRG08_010735 [Elysia crispata]|uniref:Uncharacterized protein n=1 Tax=Elysia crispata TaxID=231223 RepID=A0AAE1CU71_9GAST|nr:hypothetical protein RRG08_010735 [Elysia crispata]
MFLWTRLVLVPSRGDHYTGCSCGLGWYWFHHEATITRDVPVDSIGTGSITRRPLHGMFLWTRSDPKVPTPGVDSEEDDTNRNQVHHRACFHLLCMSGGMGKGRLKRSDIRV